MPTTPSLRGVGSVAGATSTNITGIEPTTAVNDILIACLYIEANSGVDATVTPQVGWTDKFAGVTLMTECNDAAGGQYRQYMYWIRRGASAPALQWQFISSFNFLSMASYKDALTGGDPFSFQASAVRDNLNDSTIPTVSGRTLVGNELPIWVTTNFSGPSAFTPPTGFTERFDTSGDAVSWADAAQVSTGLVTAAGATWTGPAASASAVLVGLKPDVYTPKIVSRPFPYTTGSPNIVGPRGR